LNINYIKGNFDKISVEDVARLSKAAFSGDYQVIEEIFKEYEILGTCASCAYSAKSAYKLLLIYEEQGWI